MFDNKIDTYVILGQQNRFYYSHADTSFGCVILNQKEKILITDFRYAEYAQSVATGFNVIITGGGTLISVIYEQLKKLKCKIAGFEDDIITVDMLARLKAGCQGISFRPAGAELAKERMIKTEDEIKLIFDAQKIAEKALMKTIPRIKVGITEKEVAAEIMYEMLMAGADDTSFDTIVAFGANSSRPHHKTGVKKLEKNDLILIDMGCKAAGYCSDMTRTFSLGEPADQLAAIHSIVLEAQNYALKHLKAGMTGKEADSLSREYIMANGYGKEFGHSLGHGVGIDVHENPRLSMVSDDILLPNMVVTVEPGIYVDGLGGVRIEDLVVIKEDGIQNLTDFDKDINL